jgi:predicted DNA-binding transcriptional regulator AlpA
MRVSAKSGLMGERDAADYLGMSQAWLRRCRWKKDGSGPKWYKLGGAVKYHVNDLDEYIRLCAASAAAN